MNTDTDTTDTTDTGRGRIDTCIVCRRVAVIRAADGVCVDCDA